MPLGGEPPDDVAMPIAQHGGQLCPFQALGEQKWRCRLRVRQFDTAKAHRLKGRLQFTSQVVGQHRRPLRVLAFGGQRQTAGKQGLELTRVEPLLGTDDGRRPTRGRRYTHGRDHSAFAPDTLTAFAHLGISVRMYSAYSAAVPP